MADADLSLLRPDHHHAFRAATAALSSAEDGVAIVGDPSDGLPEFLDHLVAALAMVNTLVIRMERMAAPEDIAVTLATAQAACRNAGPDSRIVLHVAEADLLRRDTLDVLNELPAVLATQSRTQLLVTGRPVLIGRLTTNGHHAMLEYLGTTIELPSPRLELSPWKASPPPGLERPAPRPRQATRPAPALGRVAAPARGRVGPVAFRDAVQPLCAAAITVAALLALSQFVPRQTVWADLSGPPGPAGLPDLVPAVQALEPGPPVVGLPTQPRDDFAPDLQAMLDGPQGSPIWRSTSLPNEAGRPVDTPTSDASSSGPDLPIPPIPPVSDPPPAAGTSQVAGYVEGPDDIFLVVRRGETLRSLYRRMYQGLDGPPYEVVAAANPPTIRPGTVVVMPAPAKGWRP